MNEKLITADELAEVLQVSKRTVKYWLADGVIPAAVHEGQVLRFDLPAVKKALAKRATKKIRPLPRTAGAGPDMAIVC
jgi:excisionase family DNA binding protein